MTIKKLGQLKRSVAAAAEGCRGVNMDAFVALTAASEEISKAIESIRTNTSRGKP